MGVFDRQHLLYLFPFLSVIMVIIIILIILEAA